MALSEPVIRWLMQPAGDLPAISHLLNRPSWMSLGACAGESIDLFFPKRGDSTAPAKAICDRCPVQAPCRAFALADSEIQGVWGGWSERQRRKWRREHAARRAVVGPLDTPSA